MEKESFSDQKVADVLNKSFIAIKVDREERPDVDSIYMDAVQAFSGSGGWPMTVLLTPDREPFFGGTYFPKGQLLELLDKAQKIWTDNPLQVKEQGKKLAGLLQSRSLQSATGKLGNDVLVKAYEAFKSQFDSKHGGLKGRMKFPPTYDLRLMLRVARRAESNEPVNLVTKTLDEMARGGIYDHVGGGFHRYATDEKWLVPHFEKMLYDQAALLNAYVEAFQFTKKKEYGLIAREIVDYVIRDMTSPEGGFYSAEDADSEGQEGLFYTWKYSEINELLSPEEFTEFKKIFSISKGGNFEDGRNILSLKNGEMREKRNPLVTTALGKLMARRSKRIRPNRDEKILVSWNGLFLGAVARAGFALNEKKYIESAEKAAAFILVKCRDKKGQLFRRFIKGEAKYPGYLEDYAFLIDGLIELYQADGDLKWFTAAEELQKIQNQLFFDSSQKFYFSTSGEDKFLIRRSRDYEDNVTPSGTSISVLNLLRLYAISFDATYHQKADEILGALPDAIKAYPLVFPQMLMAVDYDLDLSKEIAIIAMRKDEDFQNALNVFRDSFNPNKVLSFSHQGPSSVPILKGKTSLGGRPTIYVCLRQVCKLPTTNPQDALRETFASSHYVLKLSRLR